MDTYNDDLSLSLYSNLCKVFGPEDVVRTRKRLLNTLDSVSYKGNSILPLILISSGSRAEGLDDPASDTDMLFVLKNCLVYENIEDPIIHKHKRQTKIPVIMDTNDTKPGYSRLKLYDRNDLTGREWLCYEIGNEIFISSKSLREESMHSFNCQFIIHGPCISLPNSRYDIASSFHCEKWITQADEWIHRSRSSWPHDRLIERILQYGVLFVPVGCKNSSRQDLEFRISFNVAEKILVQSFSHVQLLCYALLKTILIYFIKPQYGDLLCSYFLKTIMFWVLEESIESTWIPDNFLQCFDLCFKRLVHCVTYNTCLHYFIPDLNLFEDRFSISEHDSLTRSLQSIYPHIISFSNFLIQTLYAKKVVSVSPLPHLMLTGIHSGVSIETDMLEEVTLRLIRSVFGVSSLPVKEIHALIMSQYIQQAAQSIPKKESFYATNKKRYRSYQNCLNHLLQGLHHDAVSGWLLLASFLYTQKHYQQCLLVLNYCLHTCTPDKILLTCCIDTNLQHEFNMEMQRNAKIGFQRTCKRRVVDFVRCKKHAFIIPAELLGVFDELDIFLTFPPLVFANFLHSICLHRLNRNRDKMNAFRALETTVKKMYFIPNKAYYLEISYKCIAVARQLLAE